MQFVYYTLDIMMGNEKLDKNWLNKRPKTILVCSLYTGSWEFTKELIYVMSRILLYVFAMLAVALLHPTGKPGGSDSAVAGETLEDIQSVWDIRDCSRSWCGRTRTCSVQQFTCFSVQ
jgi:hypothetical protein